MSARRTAAPILFTIVAAFAPAHADAQWFVAAYLGANTTASATVSVEVPAEGLGLEYHDVGFDARPFESPQYYGIRTGRLFGTGHRYGIEIELIHLKVYARTAAIYPVTGEFGRALVTSPGRADGAMDAVVQRYAMSHGLNFLVVNFVSRTPIGDGPVAFIARAGLGPTLPHAETTVLQQARDQYEYAGLGAHVAAGLDVRLRGRLSLVGDTSSRSRRRASTSLKARAR